MADVIAGRYALIDQVARGGAGTIWRARDLRDGSLCAVKVMRQRDSGDLLRFTRESGVSFSHPHLLAPTSWAAEDDTVAIAMPLVDGGTLEAVLRRGGALSEDTLLVILRQLLSGLAHMHERGWIHRDVKPANVLLDATGAGMPRARLADFGIAVHREDVRLTQLGLVNGTRGFLAPEVFAMADPEPSHDLYSTGILALVALNGPGTVPLQDGALDAEALEGWLALASSRLARVLRAMVAARAEHRPASAAEALRHLPTPAPTAPRFAFASGEPLRIESVLPPLPQEGAARRPTRRQAVLAAAGAGGVGLAGAAAWLGTRPRPAGRETVTAGQACAAEDVGRIRVTASGEFLSCALGPGGAHAYR